MGRQVFLMPFVFVSLMPFVFVSYIISRYSLSGTALIPYLNFHGQPCAPVIIFSHLFNLFINFLCDLIRSLRFIFGFIDLISSHSEPDFSPFCMGLISVRAAASVNKLIAGTTFPLW